MRLTGMEHRSSVSKAGVGRTVQCRKLVGVSGERSMSNRTQPLPMGRRCPSVSGQGLESAVLAVKAWNQQSWLGVSGLGYVEDILGSVKDPTENMKTWGGSQSRLRGEYPREPGRGCGVHGSRLRGEYPREPGRGCGVHGSVRGAHVCVELMDRAPGREQGAHGSFEVIRKPHGRQCAIDNQAG